MEVGLVETFERFLVLSYPEVRVQIVIDERLHHSIPDQWFRDPEYRLEHLDGAATLVHIGQVDIRRRCLLLWNRRLHLGRRR